MDIFRHSLSDKYIEGIFVNRTCHSIIGESFEITSTVSLKLEYVCIAEYTVHPILSNYYLKLEYVCIAEYTVHPIFSYYYF